LPELPISLATGIDTLVGEHDRRELEAAAARVSEAYRGQGREASRAARTAVDVAAYLAVRAPATFAATASALDQVRLQRADWQPHSVLDLGAGPGVASWAAAAAWPTISRFSLFDAEPEMIAAGQRLAAAARLTNATWTRGDGLAGTADLVLASYVLGEIEESQRDAITRKLWSSTTGTLVLVEPGTPAGYARIIAARRTVLADGGFTVAPCPHDAGCPLVGDDWCHFATRLPRRDVHRAVKRVSRGFEDEKFSYVALSREPGDRATARIIRPPLIRSGHVYLDTCEAGGVARRIVTRRDASAYRAARKAGWGDALAVGPHSTPDNEPS
jgi:ribosomal protein RSM22 (predicted rRNA methylase)